MFRDLWEDSPVLFILVGSMTLLALGLIIFVLVSLPMMIFDYAVNHDKWEKNCKEHVIVASYGKNETESDPHIVTGVSTNGHFTTGTVFTDRDVTNYYIVLDNDTFWKVPRNVGPYIKEGDLSNKYCSIDMKYIK